ncbi:MAG: aminopeptidase P family protein, partial [Chloroflexota bacterium]|nr:aminopeptidase P family protein [Chloroflexota bacterium]
MNLPRVKRIMGEQGLDGLVATTVENIYYLSGMWEMSVEMFPHDAQAYVVNTADTLDKPVVVTSVGDADMTLACDPRPGDVITYGSFNRYLPDGCSLDPDERHVLERTASPRASALEGLCAALESAGLAGKTVGLDERGLNPSYLPQVQERFPSMKIVPAAQIFRTMRMSKTDEELKRMIGALRATEAAMRATVASARAGVTERELFHVFEKAIVENHARPGFTLIRFGKGMALGQVPSGDATLTEGDYIWFDVGCTYAGYRSDIGRIWPYGEPSRKVRDYFAASKAGQTTAIEMMKPGVRAKDVFEAAVNRVRDAGIPHYQRHHVGHGIGIEYYDAPVLAPAYDTPLEEGMVFEVE